MIIVSQLFALHVKILFVVFEASDSQHSNGRCSFNLSVHPLSATQQLQSTRSFTIKTTLAECVSLCMCV